MSLDTTKIIRATERMMTAVTRCAVTEERTERRQSVVNLFCMLATDLGKIASPLPRTFWEEHTAFYAVQKLHTEAVQADERRSGTFTHLGSETAVLTNLCALAAVLGFTLSDAATADIPEDESARRYAEGHMQEAAE